MKKYLFIAAVVFATALTGCETVRCTVKGTATGAGQGISKDVENTKQNIKEIPPAINRLDEWMKKNMW